MGVRWMPKHGQWFWARTAWETVPRWALVRYIDQYGPPRIEEIWPGRRDRLVSNCPGLVLRGPVVLPEPQGLPVVDAAQTFVDGDTA